MKWFRSKLKHGSRLALLALAIQFVMSFGHHHGAAALAAPVVAVQASGLSTPLTTKATVNDSARASAERPAGPATGHHQDNDFCAVCAVMALAGTVLFTQLPALLLPEAYHFLYLTTDAEFNHIKSRHIVSQPRAPPAS